MNTPTILIRFDAAQRPEFFFNADTEQDMAWIEWWLRENLYGGAVRPDQTGGVLDSSGPALHRGEQNEPRHQDRPVFFDPS